MLSLEDGPGDIFKNLRESLTGWLKVGFSCPLCQSVWWSGMATLWLVLFAIIEIPLVPIFWMGVSGGAAIICKLVDEND